MSSKITRRQALQAGAAVAATAASCSIATAQEAAGSVELDDILQAAGIEDPSWLDASCVIAEPIESWDDEESYDVVVIGAGTTGVPAALSAFEEGASVCVLQKESCAIAQGNQSCGIQLEGSDESALLNLVHRMMASCSQRGDQAQIKRFIYSSGEAMEWYMERGAQAGLDSMTVSIVPVTHEPFGTHMQMTVRAGRKPVTHGTAMLKIAEMAEAQGVVFHYNTPAVQIVLEDGRAAAVIGRREDGTYLKVNAEKGIIIATGDYQNNEALVHRFNPDCELYERKQVGKTGDGILMGMLAGGRMEPTGHTKMVMDSDAGFLFNEPFLTVDEQGHRFMNEDVKMENVVNYLRRNKTPDWYTQVFDDDWFAQVEGWGGETIPYEVMENYIPGLHPDATGVTQGLIDTHRCDTLEEAFAEIGLPVEEAMASVARYNELCDLGFDEDFGKNPAYLRKIEKAPFWVVHRHLRVSATLSGLVTNDNFEVLDSNLDPIPGLYAAGNCAGQFYGCPDYPLELSGISIGRCITGGRVAGKLVASL